MKTVSLILEKLTAVMNLLSGVMLLVMMFSTLADVVSRAVFELTAGDIDFTFIGGVEITRYSLLIAVFFSLPYAVGRGQVIVDLFSGSWSPRRKALVDALFMFCFVLFGMAMCQQFFLMIEESTWTEETTQDLLIPLTYFYYLTTFASGVLALSAFNETCKLVNTAIRGVQQ